MTDNSLAAAITTGLGRANDILATRPATSPKPHRHLVAAGDSWFDYPFFDIPKLLADDYGYIVESSAHAGDPIEAIAYHGGQLDKLARCFEKVKAQGVAPIAVLLSGGGDDIAGPEFGMLLNNSYSPCGGWNADILKALIHERIATAYVSMLSSIDNLSESSTGKALPIVIHGYDYPVPDGRGYLGGWPFPGPWLQPGFRQKNFTVLADTMTLMRVAIDSFNEMLIGIVALPQFAHVRYVDLRGVLSAGADYSALWDNELHPTEQGFRAVTAKIAAVLATI
jgi:hypothetical protein